MKRLARKSILEIKPYKPGKPIEEVKRELGLREIIKLASNENTLGPSSRTIKALRDYLPKIYLYPEDSCFYLKKELAKRLKVKMENLIMGNGSDEIMELIPKTFLNPGEEVIYGHPSFLIYEIVTKIMGGKPVPISLKDYTYDLKGIVMAITRKTKIIFVCNPNNPTGTMVSEEEIRAFLKRVPERIIVVLDEAYKDYVERRDFPNSIGLLKEYKNIIILRTFAKIYGLAGLRIGYGIAREEVIDLLSKVRLPFNVNSLAQAAALASLKDKEQVKKTRRMNREGKRFLYAAFESLGLEYIPTQTNFILINLSPACSGTRRSGEKICRELLIKGIIIREMSAWGLNNYIRVTIGREEENKKFIQALRKALEVMR
ncbi:MAG TPA: histidinol-phosphate transaminase [bacterium]|nr:histidinol-phosphate transaminase [bacterium]